MILKIFWGCSIKKGRLITLCGGEGTGKSTQAKRLYNFLVENKIKTVLTKEPGGTKTGSDIRKILLSPESSNLDTKAELLLYMADRAQHLKEIIFPELENGKIIICDRFIDSTYVYQGAARGVKPEVIDDLHKFVLGDFLPDLTIVLDLDPKVGLERVSKDMDDGSRSIDESRFDSEKLPFHEKIRNGFLERVKNDSSGRFAVVDAGVSPDEVFEKIKNILKEKGFVQNNV